MKILILRPGTVPRPIAQPKLFRSWHTTDKVEVDYDCFTSYDPSSIQKSESIKKIVDLQKLKRDTILSRWFHNKLIDAPTKAVLFVDFDELEDLSFERGQQNMLEAASYE